MNRLLPHVLALAMLVAPAFTLSKDKSKPQLWHELIVPRVEIDVLAQDRDGNFVADLQPEDFVVYEDDQMVSIQDFELQHLVSGLPIFPSGAPVTAAPVEGRRFVLFIDLLNTSAANFQTIRANIVAFIEETLRPRDQMMITILSPSRKALLMQSFTSEKGILVETLASLHGNPTAGLKQKNKERELYQLLYPGSRSVTGLAAGNSEELTSPQMAINVAREIIQDLSLTTYRQSTFALNAIASLPEWLDRRGWFPGSKTIIYVGERMELRPGKSLVDILNRRIEQYNIDLAANPSPTATRYRLFPARVDLDLRPVLNQVVARLSGHRATLYTIDVAGTFQSASNDVSLAMSNLNAGLQQRNFFESQDTLRGLAVDTGGLSFWSRSHLDQAFQRIELENRMRYVLTYRPPERDEVSGEQSSRFREIRVQCRRPGVTVRARKGYVD